jgi:hypothetical protein
MRTAALTLLCFVAFGYAMNAQRFSLLPQVGFENAKTNISYNNLSSFSPAGVKFTPQASLRLNYASKPGHGFFLGAATSRSAILYSFTDPENGMSNFKTAAANMQLQFEGGYQFNSKPISLGRSKSNTKTEARKSCGSKPEKSSCQRSYSSSCGSRNSNKSKQALSAGGSWLRIQPSVGMGFIPVTRTDVVTKTQSSQTTYEYRAGNWQTGLIAGTSFEFGNNKTRLVTLSINYFKGLGNLNTTTLTTSDGVKSLTTNLKSDVSGWNMRVGIPFSLQKNKSASKSKKENKPADRKTNCQQYRVIRYRCGN